MGEVELAIAATNTPTWDWASFKGSGTALKLNRRDLPELERVIALTPGRSVAVQAGGNLGLWPKRLAQDFKTVYTFEPAADLFALLQRNAPESNIIKCQMALGEQHELVSMSRERRDGKTRPPHEGITHVSGPGVIPTLLVDDLGLPVCDLLALDLEGWELYALRGAKATIHRCRPVIAVEVNEHIREVGLTPEAVREFLTSCRYQQCLRFVADDVWVPNEWTKEASCEP
jgi:FkbM family methyltransferase